MPLPLTAASRTAIEARVADKAGPPGLNDDFPAPRHKQARQALRPGRKRQGDLASSPWRSIRVAGPRIGRAVPVPLVVAAATMSLRFHQRHCGNLASVERMSCRPQIRSRNAGLSGTGATLIDHAGHKRDWEVFMADVLTKLRSDLEKRLRELEPLIEEHAHVRQALEALKGAGTRAQRVATTAASGPRAAQNVGTTAASRRGRPRGTGRRAEEALKLVHRHPGITLQDMAKSG